MKLYRLFAAVFAAVSAASAFADAPDLTGSMQFLCNPNKSRWSTTSSNDGRARAMTTILPYEGKLYVSGGCWDPNMGYAPIFAVDPTTGSYVLEYQAGSERFDYFRVDSAGRIYAPVVDQHENGPNWGALFRRDLDGQWKCLKNIPRGSIPSGVFDTLDSQGYAIHTWDLCCWKGNVFTAGYGIAFGLEGSDEKMNDATPGSSSDYMADWGSPRRFKAFLPFDDDLFCIPLSRKNSPVEEWRFDSSTGVFVCEERPWDEIAPDFSSADEAISTNSRLVAPCLVTPFKGRVVYILGNEHVDAPRPLCLYTAQNVGHHVKAAKVNLGSGVFPFCISTYVTSNGDKVLNVLAAQFDESDRMVLNSVWESRNGVDFEKLFTFKTAQQATAIARTDAGFFVGIGWRFATKWNLACKDGSSGDAGDGVSGEIYHIPFSKVYRPMELSSAKAEVQADGTSAKLSVTVTCLEAASAALSLVFEGKTVARWDNVVEGKTYSAAVQTVQGKAYGFSFEGSPSGYDAVVSEGAFSSSVVEGWFSVDFGDSGYKAGEEWTDVLAVANPGGTWFKGTNSAELVGSSSDSFRYVMVDSIDEIVYTPSVPYVAGDDVRISGRIKVDVSTLALAKKDADMKASLLFIVTNGQIRACGLANGQWTVFDAPAGGIDGGSWVDYAIEIDLNSPAAPRIQYRLNGAALVAESCNDGYISLHESPRSISTVSYRGNGAFTNFSGDFRAKVLSSFPLPVIGGDVSGSSGASGGLVFGKNPVTGSSTFTATVSNPLAGAWYTAFTTTDLQEPFVAECTVRAQSGDSSIPLEVDATPKSKFIKIVVSDAPFAIGDALPVK